MKETVLYAAVLAVVASSVGCASVGDKSTEMIAAAKALDRQSVDAFNTRNVDAMMATYWNSPDLVSYPFDAAEG